MVSEKIVYKGREVKFLINMNESVYGLAFLVSGQTGAAVTIQPGEDASGDGSPGQKFPPVPRDTRDESDLKY